VIEPTVGKRELPKDYHRAGTAGQKNDKETETCNDSSVQRQRWRNGGINQPAVVQRHQRIAIERIV
jgi:hypothetical protein